MGQRRYKKKKKEKEKKKKIPIPKELARMIEERQGKFESDYNSAVESITRILQDYSVQDITTSLFVSSLWLPNISSLIKHQLIAAILVSLSTDDLKTSNAISSYEDFKTFLQRVYEKLPTFFSLEDFVPELDCGDIKFFHKGELFKIFYGNELANVYDYLMLFQLLYLPFDEKYMAVARRSPSEDLYKCLQMQDGIISKLSHQPTVADILDKINPGYIEVPSEIFWKETSRVFNNFDAVKAYGIDFVDYYSIPIGTWPKDYLKTSVFGEMVFQGKVVPAFFVSNAGRYFPLLPRRYSSILVDRWGDIFKEFHDMIASDGEYTFKIGIEVHKYIRSRIKSSFLFPLVSVVKPDKSTNG